MLLQNKLSANVKEKPNYDKRIKRNLVNHDV